MGSLLLMLSFVSCNVEDTVNELLGDLLTFDLNVNEQFSVPSVGMGVTDMEISPPQEVSRAVGPFKTGIKSLLDEKKVSDSNIESIRATNAFKSIKISLGGVVLGSLDPIPANANRIELISAPSGDLKGSINQDEISFDIEYEVQRTILNGLDIAIDGVFEVKGKVNL